MAPNMKESIKILYKLIIIIVAIGLGVFASYLLVAKGMKVPAGILFAVAISLIFIYDDPPAFIYLWLR